MWAGDRHRHTVHQRCDYKRKLSVAGFCTHFIWQPLSTLTLCPIILDYTLFDNGLPRHQFANKSEHERNSSLPIVGWSHSRRGLGSLWGLGRRRWRWLLRSVQGHVPCWGRRGSVLMLSALVCGSMQWCITSRVGGCHWLCLQSVVGSSRIRIIGSIGCVRPEFGGKGVRGIEVLKMSPKT